MPRISYGFQILVSTGLVFIIRYAMKPIKDHPATATSALLIFLCFLFCLSRNESTTWPCWDLYSVLMRGARCESSLLGCRRLYVTGSVTRPVKVRMKTGKNCACCAATVSRRRLELEWLAMAAPLPRRRTNSRSSWWQQRPGTADLLREMRTYVLEMLSACPLWLFSPLPRLEVSRSVLGLSWLPHRRDPSQPGGSAAVAPPCSDHWPVVAQRRR